MALDRVSRAQGLGSMVVTRTILTVGGVFVMFPIVGTEPPERAA